jgi:hypothetical protein
MDHETQIHSSPSDDQKDDAMPTTPRRLMTTTTLRRLLTPVRTRGWRDRRTVVSLALVLVVASGMTAGLAAAAGAAGTGAPGSAPTLTLYIGTQGSDPGHPADLSQVPGVITLNVHDVNLGFENPTSLGAASAGAGAAKATFHDLLASVPWDGSDVPIFKELTTGGHFPWAVLTVDTPAQTPGGSASFERYSFHFLFPAKLTDTSSADETQLTLLYGAVEMRAFTLSRSGGLGTPQIASWNQLTNSSDPTTP